MMSSQESDFCASIMFAINVTNLPDMGLISDDGRFIKQNKGSSQLFENIASQKRGWSQV